MTDEELAVRIADPKYRFEERVTRIMARGHGRELAEEIVKRVIEFKEGEYVVLD